MYRRAYIGVCAALSLCLALLLFSPESKATSCPVGAPATCLVGQGDWTSTLSARSFDGGNTIGGYSDSALNITWLADANYAKTSGFDGDGRMTWSVANGWANTLNINGITGWRLPTMTDIGNDGCNWSYAGGTDCGYNVLTKVGSTVYSEMANMFFNTLGDKAYCPPGDATCAGAPQPGSGLKNTGPFANLQSFVYWTDQAFATNPGIAWRFNFLDQGNGSQYDSDKGFEFDAWAVHLGDVGVAPVPLPASAWLLLSGLLALGLVARRGQFQSAAV